jgi:Fe-S-cluster containining protein
MPTKGFIIGATDPPEEAANLCRSCGACCAFSAEWPRFSTEDDAELDRIPRTLVDGGQGRMRCNGDRCAALVGDVGAWTSCAVYAVRPQVCRVCQPGDNDCQIARHRFGL